MKGPWWHQGPFVQVLRSKQAALAWDQRARPGLRHLVEQFV
jgi:hypothetical protein